MLDIVRPDNSKIFIIHKPWCETNFNCAVLHLDGFCDMKRECSCGVVNQLEDGSVESYV